MVRLNISVNMSLLRMTLTDGDIDIISFLSLSNILSA